MIARFTLKKACASIVTVGLVAATLAPGAAHAARPGDLPAVRLATVLADSGVTPATCHVINVQMNGTQPSTATCSLTQDQARSQLQQGVTPDTGTSWGCSDGNALELFDNVGYDRNGTLFCLSGNGSINLNDYGFDNRMSSWKSYQQEGKVYWDEGDTGTSFNFGRNQGNPNVGSGWNDQASSVCINDNSGASGCP